MAEMLPGISSRSTVAMVITQTIANTTKIFAAGHRIPSLGRKILYEGKKASAMAGASLEEA